MIINKRTMARWLRQISVLRWGLKFAVRMFAPRHFVGAVGAVFNDAGQVLLVKHVFRVDYPWGLPGGWVERGEHPAETVRREIGEELGLQVEVKQLLVCETQGSEKDTSTPLGLGFAFYCRLAAEVNHSDHTPVLENAYEVLAVEWLDPEAISYNLVPLQQTAIRLGRDIFEQERAIAR